MTDIVAATGFHLRFMGIPAPNALTTPGSQVAKPSTAVEDQIMLETIHPMNAVKGPPREPKRIPLDGFNKTAADGPRNQWYDGEDNV